MRRRSVRDGDQLSLIQEGSAGQPASVDRAVSQKQPSRPGAARARQRRPRGTGAVVEKGNRWYGQWYVRGRLVKRSLGPMRQPGSRDGLTRTQAEVRLRELMLETDSAPPPVTERVTIAEVGDRRIKQLARSGRKPDTTLANYESEIRIHFTPFFGEKAVDEITADDVEDFIDACFDTEDRLDSGLAALSVKTVRNLYVHLNGIFEFAVSKGWAYANPCRAVEKPASPEDDDTDIRSSTRPSSTRSSRPRLGPCAATRRRPWPGPRKLDRCETSSTWNGSRSASASDAAPQPRFISIARRLRLCSRTTSRASTVPST